MRIHKREQQTNVATSALALAMHAELDKHELTEAEWLRVVHGAYDLVMSGFIKSAIRMERHGDEDTPGGLA